MAKQKGGLSYGTARLIILAVWFGVLATYLYQFMEKGKQEGVNRQDADQATWTALYMFVPVLTAFVTFYLGTNAGKNLADDFKRRVQWTQFVIALLSTIAVHGYLLYYFRERVWLATFDWPTNSKDSFTSVANEGFKMLLFLGSIPIIAVNFLLGRNDVAMGHLPVNDSAETDVKS